MTVKTEKEDRINLTIDQVMETKTGIITGRVEIMTDQVEITKDRVETMTVQAGTTIDQVVVMTGKAEITIGQEPTTIVPDREIMIVPIVRVIMTVPTVQAETTTTEGIITIIAAAKVVIIRDRNVRTTTIINVRTIARKDPTTTEIPIPTMPMQPERKEDRE
jgi:hypothetical protein